MGMADGDAGLAAMAGEAGRGMQQERATGNRRGQLPGIGQAHEQAPPVVGQCGDPRHEAAALEVLGREAAPTPVVLELIEGILGVGAVTVELSDGEDFTRERGHQDCVFVDQGVLGERGEAQTQLLGVARIDHGQIGLDLATQHDGAPGAAPARQAQGGLGSLPALAGLAPSGPTHEAFDDPLDPTGQA